MPALRILGAISNTSSQVVGILAQLTKYLSISPHPVNAVNIKGAAKNRSLGRSS